MPLGRGTPPAHTASPGGLNPARAQTLLRKRVPSLKADAVECIVGVFCNTVQGTDSKTRFLDLVAALNRNEQLMKDAELAYEQAVRGHKDDLRKLVCRRADDLATPQRKLQLSANKQRAIEASMFSKCFRPVRDNREKHERDMRSVQKMRVGSVSTLGE